MKQNYFKHLFTALLLLYSTVAFAENVTIDGIAYDLIAKSKKATVIAGETKYIGDVVIPESVEYNGVTYSVTSIGDGAFIGCSGLTDVVIPNSVILIGNTAFYQCSGLTSIEIPNGVTSIGDMAFFYCSGLTDIKLPDTVKNIGRYAFSGCSGFTYVELPNSITSIGNYAFSDCSGLTHIVIPNSITSIGNYMFTYCSSLTSVEIPNSVTSIGNRAFNNCTALTNVEFPNSVTSIGNEAFCSCSSLTYIEIPKGVTSVGERAFYDCSSLTSVTIGSGVKEIYPQAFAKCKNLTDVYCLAMTVPSTESTAFNDSYPEYMTLHVPAEAINDYKKTEPWSSFGIIKTIEDVEIPKCAAPQISYSNGKITINCETDSAEFITEITSSDIDKFYNNIIDLTATYYISVYATATGCENSETVNATLCWVDNGEGSNESGVINIPAFAVLITSTNGVIYVSCPFDGERAAVYTTDGILIDECTIDNGTATIEVGLSKGTVAIVKIGEKSVKVVIG